MDARPVALITDHSSTEGSRAILAAAVEVVTGIPPVLIDARQFMTGGSGTAAVVEGMVRLAVPAIDLVVTPSAVIVYEIPPAKRRSFEACQRLLARIEASTLGADALAWRAATEKNLTVEQFRVDSIPHMPTISLSRPSLEMAAESFAQLGGDVWARPTIGSGGNDVFHVTDNRQLDAAAGYYAAHEMDWLMARDADNVNSNGQRHQFRVVVLDGRVVRACEHVQANPDSPCNEAQGAISTVLAVDELPAELHHIAIAATKSLGLRFAGVDLASENDGVVFEVNVHPIFGTDGGMETAAVPYVQAHLTTL